MGDYNQVKFLTACDEGDFEEVKRLLNNGVNVDFADKEGNNGLHHAAMNGKLDIMRHLVQNSISLEPINEEGKTPLHYACEKGDKECILFLVINGINPEIKSKSGQKAGDGNMDAKMLLNNVVCEEKAFNVLSPQQKAKILEIFYDIDNDGVKLIDLHKSKKFNKYIDESINDSAAEKDANDFIKSCAICNKQTVNIDEWIFAFSKLYAVDQAAYEKFVEDYDNAVSNKGKLKSLEFS